jgi:hypothetical protein
MKKIKFISCLYLCTLMLYSLPMAYSQSTRADTHESASYNTIAFKGLESGQRLQATAGSLLLQATLRPALKPGHRLQLYIDGHYHSTLETSGRFRVNGIERGKQTCQLKIFDIQSKSLIQNGTPITLDIRRNVNTGNRRQAPK